MGIYLGDVGHIELIRKSLEGSKESVVNPSDVNANRNRFSFDFEEGYLITGDFVELATIDGTDLDFVDASGWKNGIVQSSGNWYVHINELGSIKLYNNFSDSLDGTSQGRVSLTAITRDIPIRATVRSRDARCLARVTEYEINTSRESVDITVLSDEYRQQYSSLISGSGRLTAQWDYAPTTGSETVQYLMQLVLRTEIGSSFHGKFYIKSPNTAPIAGCFDPHHFTCCRKTRAKLNWSRQPTPFSCLKKASNPRLGSTVNATQALGHGRPTHQRTSTPSRWRLGSRRPAGNRGLKR